MFFWNHQKNHLIQFQTLILISCDEDASSIVPPNNCIINGLDTPEARELFRKLIKFFLFVLISDNIILEMKYFFVQTLMYFLFLYLLLFLLILLHLDLIFSFDHLLDLIILFEEDFSLLENELYFEVYSFFFSFSMLFFGISCDRLWTE